MTEQKSCGAEDAGGQALSKTGLREASERSFERSQACGTLRFSPWAGIVVTKDRMICIRHIDRHLFPFTTSYGEPDQ